MPIDPETSSFSAMDAAVSSEPIDASATGVGPCGPHQIDIELYFEDGKPAKRVRYEIRRKNGADVMPGRPVISSFLDEHGCAHHDGIDSLEDCTVAFLDVAEIGEVKEMPAGFWASLGPPSPEAGG